MSDTAFIDSTLPKISKTLYSLSNSGNSTYTISFKVFTAYSVIPINAIFELIFFTHSCSLL